MVFIGRLSAAGLGGEFQSTGKRFISNSEITI
jgi:hypothetical protein